MKIALASCLLLAAFASASGARAAVLWRGDFETGDTGQWDTPINPAGLSVTRACHLDGRHAGKVRITDDPSFVWNGNPKLDRSEFHHRAAGPTSEGHDTYVAFAFFLPRALSDHKHELGYWESERSWHQTLRFNIRGTALSFQQSSAAQPFWRLPAGAAPGRWHRLALHVHWSAAADTGFAQTWVDGRDMGRHHFATLPDKDARMFTQIGMLRTLEPRTEVIYIDRAMETDNLPELLALDTPAGGAPCPG
jgi:hypothetical protein